MLHTLRTFLGRFGTAFFTGQGNVTTNGFLGRVVYVLKKQHVESVSGNGNSFPLAFTIDVC